VKLDRKHIDLQTFLDNLDFNNLNNLNSDLLEFDDDDNKDEPSTALVGTKRSPGVSTPQLEQREVVSKKDSWEKNQNKLTTIQKQTLLAQENS